MRFFKCAETQARTGDIFLFREALYQLSYLGIGNKIDITLF